MEATWYALLAVMLTTYVVLDGFDFGAGICQLFIARSDEDRGQIIAAIGPLWDGNEVWLIASGGVLLFAFPRAYATAFSGFYLPLMMVLWLLVLRGVAIEFRSQIDHPLWRPLWSAVFALASSALALVFGVALGNVLRGVPLGADGAFQMPLFDDLTGGPKLGALDWYTVLVGAFAVSLLAVHGALFLGWKTEGALHERALAFARRAWGVTVIFLAIVTIATFHVQPIISARLSARPASWLLFLPLFGGAAAARIFARTPTVRSAFLGSCAWIAGLLAITAAVLFPDLLRSTVDSAQTLTAYNAAAGHHGLAVGLIWWTPAMLLTISYFVVLFRSFQGKVTASSAEH